MEEIKNISIEQLRPSPFNPRKKKNAETIRELSESIKAVGLIQPLTVRTKFDNTDALPVGEQYYEIICGHRRYEAAKLAEVEEVTCIVREMSDEQAREIMITENLQREDVDIFDESSAYAYLNTINKMSVKDIALKFGKSESYIYARLRLQSLDHLFRELYDAEEIPASHCMFICLLMPEIQKQLYKDYYSPTAPSWQKKNNSSLAEVKVIVMRLTRELKNAPFDTSECSTCPANTLTGCIFPEETTAKCLNGNCYAKKLIDYKVELIKSKIRGEFYLDKEYCHGENRKAYEAISILPGVQPISIWNYQVNKCDADCADLNGYSFFHDGFVVVREKEQKCGESREQRMAKALQDRSSNISRRYGQLFTEKIKAVQLDDFRQALPKKDIVEKYILKQIVNNQYDIRCFGLDSSMTAEENADVIERMTPEERRAAMLMAIFDGVDDDEPETKELFSTMFPKLNLDARNEAIEDVDNAIKKEFGVVSDEELEDMLSQVETESEDEE